MFEHDLRQARDETRTHRDSAEQILESVSADGGPLLLQLVTLLVAICIIQLNNNIALLQYDTLVLQSAAKSESAIFSVKDGLEAWPATRNNWNCMWFPRGKMLRMIPTLAQYS